MMKSIEQGHPLPEANIDARQGLEKLLSEFNSFDDHKKIRDYFLSVASPETQQVSTILEAIVHGWNTPETTVELLLEGSMNYGQVSAAETKDIDIVYLSNNLDNFDQTAQRNEILSKVRSVLPELEDVEIDIIDLSLVEAYIQALEAGTPTPPNSREHLSPYVQDLFIRLVGADSEENPTDYMASYYFEKFIDYFWVNRPLGSSAKVDGLFTRACRFPSNPIMANGRSKKIYETGSVAASKYSFNRSFTKYANRLHKRGIEIPSQIAEIMNKILS